MVEPTPAVHADALRQEALATQRRHRGVHAAQAQSPLQRLQALADASPRVAQLQRLQALADAAGQGVTQRKAPEEEEPLQGRFLSTQRKTAEDEELLQGRFVTAQRNTPEDEDLLQGHFASRQAPPRQRQVKADTAAPAATTNRTGLPDGLKSGIEALSGLSMDHVRVHYNSTKPAQLNAHAYAQGSDIHLAPGQDRHLPHEAWHLVQQAQGRVQPTLQLNGGVAVNDDPSLELEADHMGERARASGG